MISCNCSSGRRSKGNLEGCKSFVVRNPLSESSDCLKIAESGYLCSSPRSVRKMVSSEASKLMLS